MERPGYKSTSGLKLEGDDVEKSIEVLDKVLSEFEDPDSLPHIPVQFEPESPSQGNQSEDDGYMSMNGRRAKITPEFHPPYNNESPTPLVLRKDDQQLKDFKKLSNNGKNDELKKNQHTEYTFQPTSPSFSAASTSVTIESSPDTSSPISPTLTQQIDIGKTAQEALGENIKLSPPSTSYLPKRNNIVENGEEDKEIINSNQPPSPEDVEAIISKLLPRSPSTTQKQKTENTVINSVQAIAPVNNEKNIRNCIERKNITTASSYKSGNMVVQNIPITKRLHSSLEKNDCAVINANKWIPKEITLSDDSSLITERSKLSTATVSIGLVSGNLNLPAQQTTLPKTRSSNVNSSKYSSLPCSGPTRVGRNLGKSAINSGSFDSGTGDRNILGIGISAVHDAVLRGGVAKLLEPILNEHPVTIYPGRSSPISKRVPPRTLPGSIERHREVCRNNHDNELHSPTQQTIYDPVEGNPPSYVLLTSASTTNMSPLQRLAITKSPSSPLVAVQQHIILQNSVSSNQLIDNKNLLNSLQIPPCKPKRNSNNKATANMMPSHSIQEQQNIHDSSNKKNCNRKSTNEATTTDSSSEEFSDDSLEEGQSLPPPPAPPLVPPPPTLSAPVTPSKRGSIAWEINLDDPLPPPPPLQLSEKQIKLEKRLRKSNHANQSNSRNLNLFENTIENCNKKLISNSPANFASSCKQSKVATSASAKIISRRRTRSQSNDNHATDNDSISSFASTPGNSGGCMSQNASPKHRKHQNNDQTYITSKNRSSSLEWPDPPEAPVCSTEDEAASIYSDSDEIIPTYPINLTGKETYVIRKGRKERSRLSDAHTSMSSSINSRLSNEGSLLSGMTASQSLLVPNSRHSIDLGSSAHSQISISTGTNVLQNRGPIISPRSRLSLDLTSPNKTNADQPVSLNQILQSPSTNGSNTGTQTASFIDIQAFKDSYQQQNFEANGNERSEILVPSNGNSVAIVNDCVNNGNENKSNNNIKMNNNNNSNNNNINNNNKNNINNKNNNNNNNSDNNNISNSVPVNLVNGTLIHDITNTPRRELAPPIEEDEEQDSESQASRGAPLRQIENNISALLRGDIAIARIGDISHPRRPLGFRLGVHKSESAKEMLLSQLNNFGPLPPSPPISSPEPEIDSFPPLPPSPQEDHADDEDELDEKNMKRNVQGARLSSRIRLKINGESHAPAIPPHRSGNVGVPPSINTLKTRSMDAGYAKKYVSNLSHANVPGTLPCEMATTNSSRRRLQSGAFPKRSAQSPRDERRLQTSCSLPETPIFSRGCDIPRTPHRRAPEVPPHGTIGGTNNCGSRTAPRSNTNTTSSLGSSIVGIGNSTLGNNNGRHQAQPPQSHRSITQALTGAELLRLAGGPARGWYPKQRTMRPVSTEHLDRLHRTQGSTRAWDTAIGIGHHTAGMSGRAGLVIGNECAGRKPLTLPPNLTPKFFNKSPREALRRVTSLLIKKGNGKDKDKESKHNRDKEVFTTPSIHRSPGSAGDIPIPNHLYANNDSTNNSSSTITTTSTTTNHHQHIQTNEQNSKNGGQNQTTHKKKGFFKSFWKKSKHYSLDQQ